MFLGGEVGVEQLDGVSGGVVQYRQEPGGGWNLDAKCGESLSDCWGVEDIGEDTGVNFTGLAAAGSAVESRCVRVVGAVAAVTEQKDQVSGGINETHRIEYSVGEFGGGHRVVVDDGEART